MAMQKINQQQSSINFSTTEQLTGDTWIDGKSIYRKVVNIGALPNATVKSVAHGITTPETFIRFYGRAIATTYQLPLPYVSVASIGACMQVNINGANIEISTGIDRSAWTGYVVLEYTKV